jgi:hypothetical protein
VLKIVAYCLYIYISLVFYGNASLGKNIIKIIKKNFKDKFLVNFFRGYWEKPSPCSTTLQYVRHVFYLNFTLQSYCKFFRAHPPTVAPSLVAASVGGAGCIVIKFIFIWYNTNYTCILVLSWMYSICICILISVFNIID